MPSCTLSPTSARELRKAGRIPGEDAVVVNSDDDEATTSKKTGRKRPRKHKRKAVLAVEGTAGKKPKSADAGKQDAAGEKPDGPYCKIHRTASHDITECRQVEFLAEKQKQEYERRDKEKKSQDGAADVGKKNRGTRGGRRGKAGNKERPARGRDKKEGEEGSEDDEEESENEFQNAVDCVCVDGGASLHYSHRQLKQWAREINAAEPAIEAKKSLKWSDTSIIFDVEDHPDRMTGVGYLALLVSPTIRNIKVTKMLVDGGASLNLISPAVVKKMQIPDKDLQETGTFQGVNPGRTKPKGQITLAGHL